MEDKEFCLKLIRAVRRRPCLYNFSMNGYAKEAIDKIWMEVGNEVGVDGLKCKEKWRNIKVVLKRHLRKGVIKRRRKYYLFDHLRFVIPYMGVKNPQTYDPTPPISTTTIVDNDEVIEEHVVDTDPLSEETANNYIQAFQAQIAEGNNASLMDHTYNDDSLIQEEYNYHIPIHTEINSRKRRLSEDTHDHETKKSYHVELSNHRNKEEEAKKAFLMSLLPDLNQMNGQQMRYFKKCVLGIVEEILDGDLPATFETVNSSNIRSQKFC